MVIKVLGILSQIVEITLKCDIGCFVLVIFQIPPYKSHYIVILFF
jgi:hypothetical protein